MNRLLLLGDVDPDLVVDTPEEAAERESAIEGVVASRDG
jgi:hypothetical protein